jgi:hypothetical protein
MQLQTYKYHKKWRTSCTDEWLPFGQGRIYCINQWNRANMCRVGIAQSLWQMSTMKQPGLNSQERLELFCTEPYPEWLSDPSVSCLIHSPNLLPGTKVTSTMTIFQCRGLDCVKCYTSTSITCFHWTIGKCGSSTFHQTLCLCVFFLHMHECKCSYMCVCEYSINAYIIIIIIIIIIININIYILLSFGPYTDLNL